MMARHLATKGLLEAFAQQVRLVRGRFGSYEPIDFLALLVGYAISGERTLSDFFERVAPFETAFMALFGRRCLPPRSSLSRAPFRCRSSLFGSLPRTRASSRRSRRGGPRKPLAASSRRLGRRYLVFDVDATRQAARQRALPCGADLPTAKRREGAVCAPGAPSAQARRGSPHAHHSAVRCTHANGSGPMRARARGTIVGNWPRRSEPSRLI